MNNTTEKRNLVSVVPSGGKKILIFLVKLLLLKSLRLSRCSLLLIKPGRIRLLLHSTDIAKRLTGLTSLLKTLKIKVSTELLVLHLSLLLSIELPLCSIISSLLPGSLNLP
jgi:hypothetical protein